jgi:hypothetical protein
VKSGNLFDILVGRPTIDQPLCDELRDDQDDRDTRPLTHTPEARSC